MFRAGRWSLVVVRTINGLAGVVLPFVPWGCDAPAGDYTTGIGLDILVPSPSARGFETADIRPIRRFQSPLPMSSTTDSPTTRATVPQTASFEDIVTDHPDLVLEMSDAGVFTAFHGGPEEDLYVPPGEFMGEHYSEVLPPDVAEKFEEALQEVRETGDCARARYGLPFDEEFKYFECRFVPMDSGQILTLIVNITESWRIQRELEKSEQRYRTLVNNLPGLVYRCRLDEDWTALHISSGIDEMLGYSPEDLLDGDLTLAALIHPEDRQGVREDVLEAIEIGQPFRLSYRMVDTDGEIRHVSERGQAVCPNDSDEPEYLDGVIFDVTELHQMRQRVLVNNKMAAVGDLAAGLAHEINNPLTVAMANLQYVDEELETIESTLAAGSPAREALEDVFRAMDKSTNSIDRVRVIIEKLRTFTDAAESRADQLDPREVVDWAVRRKKGRLDNGDRIEADLQDVPPVWASEVGVVQVVWSLVDNALQALDRDGGNDQPVRVVLRDDDERVRLEIRDDGPGMTSDVVRRAFDPFFTTRDVGRGAGLGLFVCRGIVDGMDGDIEIDTEPGDGTTVRVTLPTMPHAR